MGFKYAQGWINGGEIAAGVLKICSKDGLRFVTFMLSPCRRHASLGKAKGRIQMKVLGTPDHRFSDLPDCGFVPNYLMVDDTEGRELRVHYLDEGPKAAYPVPMMHGEPSWSYLYRHMIRPVAAAGLRVITPDRAGFGKSDKPVERTDFTYARHVFRLRRVLRRLDLRDTTPFRQDWGGLIGQRLWAEIPDRFARIMVANAALLTGDQPL